MNLGPVGSRSHDARLSCRRSARSRPVVGHEALSRTGTSRTGPFARRTTEDTTRPTRCHGWRCAGAPRAMIVLGSPATKRMRPSAGRVA